MNKALTRRDFLGAAGTAGAIALSARSRAQAVGANNRLRMGFIGCGTIAQEHFKALGGLREEDNVEMAVFCDVNPERAQKLQQRARELAGGAPEVTQRFEEVLERQDIDYVLIATPEHTHAYLAQAALSAGKHVYVEKPVTHTIEEGLALLKKVRETKLQVQVGVQGMADDSYSSAHEAIKAGKIGTVVQAQIDYVRDYKAKGPFRKEAELPLEKPERLDWETWLHPAPAVAWDAHRYHEWRCYRDYSGGIATDLFVHRISRLIRACGLGYPSRVVGMGGIYLWDDGRDLPDNFDMLAEYPAVEGITKGMTLQVIGTMANDQVNPHCIRGSEATLFFTEQGWEIKPDNGRDVVERFTKTRGEDLVPHHKNHHAAIREGAALNCPVEMGLYGLVPVAMANQSWFERRMMAWDATAEKVVPA